MLSLIPVRLKTSVGDSHSLSSLFMLPNLRKMTRACISYDNSFLTIKPWYLGFLDFLKGLSWSLGLLIFFFSCMCP